MGRGDRRGRWIAIAAMLIILAIAGWLYTQYIQWFGFPDGFSSELGRAEFAMANAFCLFSLAAAASLALIVWRSFYAPVGRVLVILLGLYALAVVTGLGLDVFFRSYMTGDWGG